MNFDFLRMMTLLILKRRNFADWEYHGFGFLRARLGPNTRLHVWDQRYAASGVSMVHDHQQWAFASLVLCGRLENVRYSELLLGETDGWNMQQVRAGVGGGLIGAPTKVQLSRPTTDAYLTGESYSQEPEEIHETLAEPGTVTIIQQRRTPAGSIARVFWPEGREWGTAVPRAATQCEVNDITDRAIWKLESATRRDLPATA